MTNAAFDPGLLDYGTQRYDNALHASAAFRAFEQDTIERLVRNHDLAGRTVVEIGCGEGRFLGLLAEAAGAHGIGYDPGHDPAVRAPAADRAGVEIHRGTYPASNATAHDAPALVICRQTLEHVLDPVGFLRTLRAAVADDGVLYLDVPDSRMPFEHGSVWDLIYEHCLYFVDVSLAHTLAVAGLHVGSLRPAFSGQFLAVEAVAGPVADALPTERELAAVTDAAARFAATLEERTATWQTRLAAARAEGRRVAAWGAGARAVTFANLLDHDQQSIAAIVDLNPHKQGTYLAGTGHPIVPPEVLVGLDPDTVVVFNPLYRDEVATALGSLGIDASVVVA
ncbi:class I SAM-dependent methyltransferase [Egibacter rhizosphaerae]|uniref:class I SAM-dependent methyltransferase n=1 Tax=Egibacter rhizosphaerae TaxID=1670831 RepID=UPI00197ACFF3|nr:class I SAM-dependent methyltransferase [Egibacter rhizosphaerae]